MSDMISAPRAQLRKKLKLNLRDGAEWNRFLLDYFPEEASRLVELKNPEERINELFLLSDEETIEARLAEFLNEKAPAHESPPAASSQTGQPRIKLTGVTRRSHAWWLLGGGLVLSLSIGAAVWFRTKPDPKHTLSDGTVKPSTLVGNDAGVSPPPTDCKELHRRNPSLQSGVYEIALAGAPRTPFRVYCDMQTQGGGWTLCLNANYTREASYLFTPPYRLHYGIPTGNDHNSSVEETNNPFGYYDFCNINHLDSNEYLYALGNHNGATYQFNGLAMHLPEVTQAPVPSSQDGAVYDQQGLSVSRSKITFVRNDSIVAEYNSNNLVLLNDDLYIYLYIHNQVNGLKQIGRGLLMWHLNPESNRARELVAGAGCHYEGCVNNPADWKDLALKDKSNWSWAVTASVGVFLDNVGWQGGHLVRADRVLLFYRSRR